MVSTHWRRSACSTVHTSGLRRWTLKSSHESSSNLLPRRFKDGALCSLLARGTCSRNHAEKTSKGAASRSSSQLLQDMPLPASTICAQSGQTPVLFEHVQLIRL